MTHDSKTKRASFNLLAALAATVIICLPHSASAADINLRITKDGNVLQDSGKMIGEVYRGWRREIVFSSLSQQVTEGRPEYTVTVTSDDNLLDLINPSLYAVHGATATLVNQNIQSRTWEVSAPTGSQVTLVSELSPGILNAPLVWKMLNFLSLIPDLAWFIMATVIPGMIIFFLLLRRRFDSPKRPSIYFLDPKLLTASPASLTVLWRGFVSRRATTATLIDLAERGHLQMLIRENSVILYRKLGRDRLRSHEEYFMQRWFGQSSKSQLSSFEVEVKKEIISNISMSANLSIYDETKSYGWFNPPPLISHWKLMTIAFLLTVVFSLLFGMTFIVLPSATPLLWFWGGILTVVAILYTWAPQFVHHSILGKTALNYLASARYFMTLDSPIHPSLSDYRAWETWLPLAMVLDVAPQWLTRWEHLPFQQPTWLITEDPVIDFRQFLEHLQPVLDVASESIRDKILPAYL